MGFFDIILKTETGLHPFEEPDQYIAEYRGIIRYERDRDQRIFNVGKVRVYRVLAGLAADHGESLFDVYDAHSQSMHELYAALYDHEQGLLREDLIERYHAMEPDILILDYVVLHPKWRGLKLGLLAVRKIVDLLGGGCGLAVSEIYPLNPDAHNELGVPLAWIPRNETDEGRKAAIQKVRRYFRRMGFRRVDKLPYYVLPIATRTPTDWELLGPS